MDRTNIKGAGRLVGIAFHPLTLVAIASLPVLLYPFAPVIDAPNHLARIWLAAQAPLTGIQARAYIIDWANTSSNFLVDLIGSWIVRVSSLRLLATVLLWLMIVGPAVAMMGLARRVHGRVSIYHCLPLAAVWGQSMASGFINYSISLGLAAGLLLLDLAVLRDRPVWISAPGRALAILGIYLCHPFGVPFYVAIDLALAYGWPIRMALRDLPGFAWRCAQSYILPGAALAAYLGWNSATNPAAGKAAVWGGLQTHLIALPSPFFAYDEAFEIAISLPILAALIAGALAGRIRMHGGLMWASALLFAGAMAIPDSIGDGAWLTRRLPLMAVLILFLSLRPLGRPGRGMTVLLGSAILAHVGWIGWVWSQRAADYDDLVAIARVLPADSLVIVVRNVGVTRRWAEPGKYIHGGQYTRRHFPDLLVPLAHVYIPTLFSLRGQQPLRIAPAFQPLSSPSSTIPTLDDLRSNGKGAGQDAYLINWACGFDAVLVLEQDERGRGREDLPMAHRVKTTPSQTLYRLNPGACKRPT